MPTRGTPSDKFKYRPSKKDLKKSYEVRLAAQFGDSKAKRRLENYNRRQKERKMEISKERWDVDGRYFTRYQLMDYVVTQVSDGLGLPEVCDVKGMPSMLEVYSWFDNHPEFEKAYRRAEEIRAHRMGERAREIAENTDRENVAADKLKVETLSKFAARGNARFQDKQVVQTPDDDYDKMTPEQIRTKIGHMLRANPELGSSLASLGIGQQQTEPSLPTLDLAQSEILCADENSPTPEDPSPTE